MCWRFFIDMNLQSDDFELMGLPRQFVLDRDLLDARWKELQKQAHPDRFSAEGGVAQRIAMQWSVPICVNCTACLCVPKTTPPCLLLF